MNYDSWKLDYPGHYDYEDKPHYCPICDSELDQGTKPYDCPVCLEDEELESEK